MSFDDIIGSTDTGDTTTQMFKTVVDTLAPGEESDVVNNFAALGAIKKDNYEGLGLREQLIKTSQERTSALGSAKARILETIAQDRPLSKSETAAMLLIGLLPIAAGGLMKGKKGIAIGAQAGALGTQIAQKGFESETKRAQDTAKIQLASVQAEQEDERKFQQQATLAEASAQDTAVQKELDRQQSTLNASIRAGGDAAAGKAIALALKEREGIKVTSPIDVGDGKIAIPSQAVDKETSDGMHQASQYYQTALKSIQDIVESSNSMDFAAFQRSLGDTGTDLYQKYVLAHNAIMAVKRIPGLKGTEAITNLDKFIGNPASLARNLYKSIPGVGSVPGEYRAAYKNLSEDFQSFLKANNYHLLSPGMKKFIKGPNGEAKEVTIGKVYPDGTFDPVEE